MRGLPNGFSSFNVSDHLPINSYPSSRSHVPRNTHGPHTTSCLLSFADTIQQLRCPGRAHSSLIRPRSTSEAASTRSTTSATAPLRAQRTPAIVAKASPTCTMAPCPTAMPTINAHRLLGARATATYPTTCTTVCRPASGNVSSICLLNRQEEKHGNISRQDISTRSQNSTHTCDSPPSSAFQVLFE